MTIEELKEDSRTFVKFDDVCPDILPICVRTLKEQIAHDPKSVNFTIVKIGRRMYIPRLQFLHSLEANDSVNIIKGKEVKA